jgi:pimeloyl-ACP methyl ester carboxylesterase
MGLIQTRLFGTIWSPNLLACYFKVVVFEVFSPNVNPDLYNPKKYSNFNGYVQDLLCLLDQLNLNVNKTIYVGHSMSAMIGCIAETKRPELFQHLILLSGSPRCCSLSLSLGTFIFFSSSHAYIHDRFIFIYFNPILFNYPHFCLFF